MLELINHSPDGQVEINSMSVRSKTKIQKDEQIFISYGELSNEELLVTYGFVIDEDFYQKRNEHREKLECSFRTGKNEGLLINFGKQETELG